MERLFEKFQQKIAYTHTEFVRSLMDTIHWDARMIGICGARGVGKTTLLLQRIKLFLPTDQQTLYVSLDNIWFAEHKIYDLTDMFVKRGGRYLFLDEVHKYPNWSQELKNIYDDFPELKVVFTGSSLLEILNAKADLSRRAIVYKMQGFSFREYLNRNQKTNFPIVQLSDVLRSHVDLSASIIPKIKVLHHFSDYLKFGYYPYYNELPELYFQRISEVVNMTLEVELPMLRGVDVTYVPKVKQLLQIISDSVPFVPNISKLSERIGITRNALLGYLNALHESRITMNVNKQAYGISQLQKPEKIFLENTNLMMALSMQSTNIGNLRETFFANQLSYHHQLLLSTQSDFFVDGRYTFEIGGEGKGYRQLEGLSEAYIAADDIEFGSGNKIPLWAFGFLY